MHRPILLYHWTILLPSVLQFLTCAEAQQLMGIPGKECRLNNSCLDPKRVICETKLQPPICKFQPGVMCRRNPDQCVVGASCRDNTCTCDTVHTQATDDGFCSPLPRKVEGTCDPTASHPCEDSKARCTTSSASGKNQCQCLGTHTVNYQTFDCDPAPKTVNGTCNESDDPPCFDVNAVCSGSPATCRCKDEFVTSEQDDTCVLAAGVNCSGREEQCRPDTVCDPSTNLCKIGHNKTCVNSECVSFAICLPQSNNHSLCTCRPGVYKANSTTGTCYPEPGKVGGTCVADDIISCDDINSICNHTSNICTCREGLSLNETNLSCEELTSTSSSLSVVTQLLLFAVGWSAMTFPVML